MTQPVQLYLRVEPYDEVCMGTAQSMQDIPRMLEEIAALFRGRFAAELYGQSVSGCACLICEDR